MSDIKNSTALPQTKRGISDKISTFIYLLIAMTSNSFGDVLLSRTVNGLGNTEICDINDILTIANTVLSQSSFWIAILCFTVFFGLWTMLMSKEDISYLMPLSAVTYVISGLLAGPMLGEYVSAMRWSGIILIVIGVSLVASTGHDNDK